jgi:RNA polymerase sigma-70 factor (ECF subfamily)
VHDAEDLTQEFFFRLLARNYLSAVDRHRGRFRSFLLKSFNHFLHREWRDARAQKRGGGVPAVPLDGELAEQRYQLEPSQDLVPERLFERRWAMTVLEAVMERLRQECVTEGKGRLFEYLKGRLSGDAGQEAYVQVGRHLHMSEGAVKTAMYRLRQRYADLLREEVAHTVATPQEVEEELRHLLTVLMN